MGLPALPEMNLTDTVEDGLPAPRRYLALAAGLSALVLVVLDGAIANVALPTISVSLDVSAAASVWVVIGYQMALVIALLPCAALGESLGHRRVFVGGVVVFTAASLLCALSPSLPWLIGARFLQGIGGAAVMSLAATLMRFSFPHSRLGSVVGWNAMTIALAAAVGPTIGAAIISIATWPWLFAVNLPVGVIVLLAGRALPNPAGTRRKLDLVSVLLNGLAFGSLILGADLLVTRPLPGSLLLVAAMIALAALIHRELPRQAPLIPLDLLRDGSFRLSVIASICCFSGQMASYVALPFYLQHGLGQSAFDTGLYMTPWPLTVAIAAPLAGRLTDRVSTAWLCAAGCTCFATGLVLICVWPLEGNLLPLIPFTMLCGLGFGFFQVPNNRNMLFAAPRQRSAAVGGVLSTGRLMGQTTGAVLMTILFTLLSVEAAPRIGLGLSAILVLAAGVISTLRAGRSAGSRP